MGRLKFYINSSAQGGVINSLEGEEKTVLPPSGKEKKRKRRPEKRGVTAFRDRLPEKRE